MHRLNYVLYYFVYFILTVSENFHGVVESGLFTNA